MKFEEIIAKSIKSFFAGNIPQKTAEANNDELFYTPDYFDELEERLLDKKKETDDAAEEV
jgi:hypothetical protein